MNFTILVKKLPMKRIALFIFLLLLSCKKQMPETVIEESQSTNQPKEKQKNSNLIDYNGDGQPDEATVKLIRQGEGNPVEDGTPSEYSIVFNGKLPDLPIGCCDATIIDEGDLDNDGADEFSAFQSPMNGCTYSMTTYSFKKGAWMQLVKPFLIPTGCDEIPTEDLEKRVFIDNGKIYFMETDMNDEDMKLVKKEVK